MTNLLRCDILVVLLDVSLTLENSTVFQRQIGEQVLALQSIGYKIGILTVYEDLLRFEKIIGKQFKKAGIYTFLIKKRHLFWNMFAMAKRLRHQQRVQHFKVCYVRGIWGPLVLALANPRQCLPYIYDVRGALVDETKAVSRTKIKQWIYKKLEAWGICHAHKVTAVSKPLAEMISHTYQIAEIEIIPSCVRLETIKVPENVRITHRSHLGYKENDIVFVYAGGLGHYQQIPAMLTLWERLLDISDLKFLLLTNTDPQQAPAVFNHLSIRFKERLKHFSLSSEEVSTFLAIADIGFMLRDARELNRAASPVKFAEYLAAGLTIVASPGTGDISAFIEKYQLGVLIDPAHLVEGEKYIRELIERVRIQRTQMRMQAQMIAEKYYDWRAYTKNYIHLYGKPLSQH